MQNFSVRGVINNRNKILGIVSAKGGVGKTTTAINLGASAAGLFGKKVLILDTNLNTGNLSLNLGFVYNPRSFYNVIKSSSSILHSIHKHKSGLHIIPSSLVSERRKINSAELKRKLKNLDYDLILLDSSPGINEDTELVMKTSDGLLLITTPDFPSIGVTLRTIEFAKQLGVPIWGIVLNKVKNKRYEIGRKRIESSLHLPIISVVREDNAISDAVAASMPVVLHKKRSPASISFKKLTAMLFGEKIRPSFLSRLVEIFKLRKYKDQCFSRQI